jgi:ABC-2 type transport system ATP-binding protein
LSGRRNLDLFAGVLGLRGARRRARVAACIALAGLERYADRRSEDYSGGIKRRLNLAIGFLNEPRILCLDEPTVGIDPQSRHFLLEQIKELNRGGVTVIYTSHNMGEVQQICTHVAILDRGRVLVSGLKDELLRGGDQVIEIGLAPGSQVPQEWLAGESAVREGDLLRLAAGTSLASLATLLGRLAASGVCVTHLSFGRRNLEDLFMQLTNRSLRD